MIVYENITGHTVTDRQLHNDYAQWCASVKHDAETIFNGEAYEQWTYDEWFAESIENGLYHHGQDDEGNDLNNLPQVFSVAFYDATDGCDRTFTFEAGQDQPSAAFIIHHDDGCAAIELDAHAVATLVHNMTNWLTHREHWRG